MQSLPEDSIIFYADSGVVFNKPIEPIVKMLDQHDIVLVGHGNPITLTRHAKAETFILAPELAKTKDDGENIWAFFLALRNNQKNRDFIKRWLDLCMIPEAIMDLPLDPAIQLPNFTLHQHDQSLLSLLVASEPKGKAIIKRNILRKEYGVRNFHRHDEEKLTSPLYLQSGLSRLISNIFWNNYLLQYLRKE